MVIFGHVVLGLVTLYLFAGAAFALRFATRSASLVNARARISGVVFRVFLLPGAMLLWPWLWQREMTRPLSAGEDGE